MTLSRLRLLFVALALVLLAVGCGSDTSSSSAGETDADGSSEGTSSASEAGGAESSEEDPSDSADADRPTIVVTTNILGNVVEELVGGQAMVVTIMPVGADPHDFQASAQEVDQMVSADALITNGGNFEEGLLAVIDNTRDEGVPTHEALETVETIEFGEGGHDHDDHGDEKHDGDDDHGDEEHDDEEHDDEEHDDEEHDDHGDDEHSDEEHDDHDHEGADPHFWTDPTRMASAVDGIVDFLTAEVPGLDAAELEASAATYVGQLEALDDEVTDLVGAIPDDGRILITNHDAFGYFADRYGFEIVGVVIPGGGTTGSVSAGELAGLAELIEDEGVAAIFSETTTSDELITVLADEVGREIDVVELYSGSLGEAGSDGATYLDMVRTNAQRISAALA